MLNPYLVFTVKIYLLFSVQNKFILSCSVSSFLFHVMFMSKGVLFLALFETKGFLFVVVVKTI